MNMNARAHDHLPLQSFSLALAALPWQSRGRRARRRSCSATRRVGPRRAARRRAALARSSASSASCSAFACTRRRLARGARARPAARDRPAAGRGAASASAAMVNCLRTGEARRRGEDRALRAGDRRARTGSGRPVASTPRSLRRGRSTLAALLVVGSAAGAMPLWPVFALCGCSSRSRRRSVASRAACGRHPADRSSCSPARRRARTRRRAARDRRSAGRPAWSSRGSPRRWPSRPRSASRIPLLAALVILPALDVAARLPAHPGRDRHRQRRRRGRAREPRHRHDATRSATGLAIQASRRSSASPRERCGALYLDRAPTPPCVAGRRAWRRSARRRRSRQHSARPSSD